MQPCSGEASAVSRMSEGGPWGLGALITSFQFCSLMAVLSSPPPSSPSASQPYLFLGWKEARLAVSEATQPRTC